MSHILEVNNLKKYFKTPKGTLHAVDDVTFHIDAGETLGVVGESGCGKSTLGRTIVHLQPPTAGEILFDGRDASSLKGAKLKEYRKDMQMIFQDPYSSLNPRWSVSEIIAEPLVNYNICKSRAELEKRVLELMDTVGLAKRLTNSYPHELDGGRRQRIGIARALSLNPRFIVSRRAGIGPGCVDPGADSELNAGSAGGAGPDIYVYHPQHVRGKAYLQQYPCNVSWKGRGVCLLR